MINFNITKEEADIIGKIIERAMLESDITCVTDRMSLYMDLAATHANGNPMNFELLLSSDDFTFFHDVVGIMNNINRDTGKLKNLFSPRCSL